MEFCAACVAESIHFATVEGSLVSVTANCVQVLILLLSMATLAGQAQQYRIRAEIFYPKTPRTMFYLHATVVIPSLMSILSEQDMWAFKRKKLLGEAALFYA